MTPEGNTPIETTADSRGGSAGGASIESRAHKPVPSIGTWEWDALTGKISWSAEIYQIMGLDPRTFEPDIAKITALTIEEDRWVHGINATDTPPLSYSIYFRIRRPDGTLRTVRETGGASPNWSREAPRVVGTLMDVTEPVLLSHVMPATIGAWHWDSANRRIRASPEALEILGLSKDGV